MGGFSIWHWLVVLLIVLLLFGANKIPQLMGDFAKGIRSFKAGLKEEDAPAEPAEPRQIDAQTASVQHPAGQTSSQTGASSTIPPRTNEPARH